MSDILLQVDINAERSKVTDALTTQPGITGWWTDKAEVSPGVGGMVKPSFDRAPLPFDLKVEEASNSRVVWRAQSFPPHWVGTEVVWQLSDNPDGPGTRVDFTHAGFQPEDPGVGSAAFTWAQTMARLKGYAETGTRQPYFTS
jgi:uncharacterized protein YndB with AHSA1/START domain